MLTPERIDLYLPTTWNRATTSELEIVARVMMDESDKMTSYHPFDLQSVKLALFFLLSDLEVCSPVDPAVDVEDQYCLCRRSYSKDPWYRKLWRRMRGNLEEPFAVYLYQIDAFIKENLKWIDKPSDLLRFPYAEIHRRGVKFAAPSAFMQDFSWQRYRYASDFFTAYVGASNRLVAMQKDTDISSRDLRKQMKLVDNYRAMFLATLFTRKVKHVDEDTRMVVNNYSYLSNQSVDNARYFRGFSDVKFQVILFWWAGMHQWLKRSYPHCFKKTEVRKAKSNPLELYTRTTATMEKYLGMSEKEVNRQVYTIIFQHLEDMAKQSEEMEKIKNKP